MEIGHLFEIENKKVVELINQARRALGLDLISEVPDLSEIPAAVGALDVNGSLASYETEEKAKKVAKVWEVGQRSGYIELPHELEKFCLVTKFDFDKALQLVNEAREALRLEPISALPGGIPTSFDSCPLARALNAKISHQKVIFSNSGKARVVGEVWSEFVNWTSVELPDELRTFVLLFDRFGKREEQY